MKSMPVMKKKQWIFENLSEKHKNSPNVCSFLYKFYSALEEHQKGRENVQTTKSQQLYKQSVEKLLHEKKASLPLSKDQLRELQMQIEGLSMGFHEQCLYKEAPNLIKILIQDDKLSAKDYLIDKLDADDKDILSEFGKYTLEALIIYVLSLVFNTRETETMIRASSLIDHLDSYVRTHSRILKSHNNNKSTDHMSENMSAKKKYYIGGLLLEFMRERSLVSFITKDSVDGGVKKKSKGGYYYQSNIFVVCTFDISLLPIKLNLPMIFPPLDWNITTSSSKEKAEAPRYLSDLVGGYLCRPTGAIYNRSYRLLSSGDLNHFYIKIGKNYRKLCNVMNALQRQPFRINSFWLDYLLKFEDLFVDEGLLMPKFLASLNICEVHPFLRQFHMKDSINKEFSFNEFIDTVLKTIQRSRYEQLILNLARAYNGYDFYLPAFLDFRGRIYRCGILHFHERDLSRSLIVFASNKTTPESIAKSDNALFAATAFHYNSFNSISDAHQFLDTVLKVDDLFPNLLTFSMKAKRPFQFCANILALTNPDKADYLRSNVPITQDASSSAYQIMSFFLLDDTLAWRTNLIPDPDNEIKDVYLFILDELLEYMKTELEPNLCSVVSKHIDRKIVKSIFMPLIYGKTLMSTATDLQEHFSQHLVRKECFLVAKVCFKFFREKYAGMDCLMKLIRLIGWVASARGSPVKYKVSYFTTVQDYYKMEPIFLWVYDRLLKKKRRVTLRVSSDKRDLRKTETSTFVNFIHQKDAFIAMNVVEELLSLNIPIYTVHDNFITTSSYCEMIPQVYVSVFRSLGPPLLIINKFIYMNVIQHLINSFDYENNVISKKILKEFLNQNIPENISKQKKIIWDKKISEILICYSDYLKIVCGEDNTSYKDSWKSHQEKWQKFSVKLYDRGSQSFSVHY